MKIPFPIYIINLKRNPERRLHIQRQLDAFGLEYQFVDVEDIDKYALESKAYRNRIAQSLDIGATVLENKYNAILNHLKTHYRGAKYEQHKNDNLGQLAIILSHIKIYDLMVKNDIAAACILEDDAKLLPTFPKILNTATGLEWDILLLASQPSSFDEDLIPNRRIKRIRIFNKDLLFIGKRIENHDSKEQEHRIACLLEEYGFNPRLYPGQAKIITKILQAYDAKYAEILGDIVPDNRRLSIVKHTQYITYRTLRRNIKVYTHIRLGALPEKSSLKRISDNHCIAEPRHCPFSATAYLLKQSAAMQWKQQVLAENPLAIDEIPWQLYRDQKIKLRLVTPPCATGQIRLYTTRQTDVECVCGKFQWQVPR